MVRGLSQWTKTLSFPARVSPQRPAKESKGFHVSPSASPTSPPSPINDNMDKAPIITDENFQDLEAEKAIMGSIVYCIHHKDGCKWSDELRKLKAHLNTCKHDAVPCSNKCGAMIPRVLMEDHLKYTCAQRRARCDFCAKEFTGHTLEKHTGTCGYEPLYCENKCGMKVQRRHLSQHKLGECAKRLVACRYCNKEFVFDTLGAHHAKCGRYPVACPHRWPLNTKIKDRTNLLIVLTSFLLVSLHRTHNKDRPFSFFSRCSPSKVEHAPRRSKFVKRAVSMGYSRRDTILKQVDPFLLSRYKTGCANASSECIASLLASPTVCRSLRDLRENNDRYFVLRTRMYLCTCYAIISSRCTAIDTTTYEIHTSGIKRVKRKRNRIDKHVYVQYVLADGLFDGVK